MNHQKTGRDYHDRVISYIRLTGMYPYAYPGPVAFPLLCAVAFASKRQTDSRGGFFTMPPCDAPFSKTTIPTP